MSSRKAEDPNQTIRPPLSSSMLRGLMIGVFPLVYLGAGIVVVVRRRRVQNETV